MGEQSSLALSSGLPFIITGKTRSRSLGELITFHSHSGAEQTGLMYAR